MIPVEQRANLAIPASASGRDRSTASSGTTIVERHGIRVVCGLSTMLDGRGIDVLAALERRTVGDGTSVPPVASDTSSVLRFRRPS
jgi:hypothetical protein